jgi:hypothetical protein
MYHEFADDPKVQMMPEHMQRRLVMLFCFRCKDATLHEAHLAFYLRISATELAETKALFLENGFIGEDWELVNWNSRQFVSDSSAERVKKYRDKRQASGLNRGSSHLSDPFLYERDCNRCIYCGDGKKLCIDHIFPISKGGDDHYDNLGVSCKSCNSGKAGRTPEEANYRFVSPEAEQRYRGYISRRVTVTVTPPEQNRTETETEQSSKATTPTPPVTPAMVAQGVLTELHLVGKHLLNALVDVVTFESQQPDYDPENTRDAMIAAYREFDSVRAKLRFTPGAEKFFGEGYWRDKSKWQFKDGMAPPPKSNGYWEGYADDPRNQLR